jgi:hypothetical protein
MSVKRFCTLLLDAEYAKNDRIWFPRCVRRYASSVKRVGGILSICEQEILCFFPSLRDDEMRARHRSQAACPNRACRNVVQRTFSDRSAR